MKKLIITIILFMVIALGFNLYKSYSDKSHMNMSDEKNTAVIVKSFIDMMIPHHMEAVQSSLKVMVDLDIAEPKIRIFAANVVDTQSFEIDKMKNIYREYLGMDYDSASSTYKNMMNDRANLKGEELAKAYTKDMIKHHKMAIDEAKDYIKLIDKIRKASSNTENGLTIINSHPAVDDTYELAKHIVEIQEKEIEVLKTWYR